jgi:bifunctional DNA-binding transcriptional regulator/antitoxin component of YhaV-PrlF toxin-antitoxin module
MSVAIEEISTITAKGQTTVPKAIRQALGVDYGGRIAFRVSGKGVTSRIIPSGSRRLPRTSPRASRP